MSKLKVTGLYIHITIRSFYCLDHLRFMFKPCIFLSRYIFLINAILQPQFKSGTIATQHSYTHFKPNNAVQDGFFDSLLEFNMRQLSNIVMGECSQLFKILCEGGWVYGLLLFEYHLDPKSRIKMSYWGVSEYFYWKSRNICILLHLL